MQVAYVPLLNLKYHLCTTALNKPSMARHPTMSTHVLSNLPMSHPRLKLYGCFEQNTCTGYHYEPDIDYNNFSIVVTKNINFFQTNTTKQIQLNKSCSVHVVAPQKPTLQENSIIKLYKGAKAIHMALHLPTSEAVTHYHSIQERRWTFPQIRWWSLSQKKKMKDEDTQVKWHPMFVTIILSSIFNSISQRISMSERNYLISF